MIIGDVEHGARVTAKGNVIILGELKGTVTAGAAGNDQAVILAFSMSPLQLRIADHTSRFNEKNRRLGKGTMMASVEAVSYTHLDVYKRQIITGGTGFYIQALLYDIDFKENNEKNPIRKELEQLAKELGDKAPGALHEKLSHIDPEAARQIHANNIKRVIRAIEYFEQTGEKISEHNEEMHQKESPYNFLYYVPVSYTHLPPARLYSFTTWMKRL